ncbi:hypothetical protein BE221DRAFT_62032 [Ostreococcus tauri]|uniref:Uncharacterized protein n=1 Tax=Ostreococcus tauri TaxID=70448 RepID=A0A1Y5HZD1_OSTTA|nr:hypothetical protein BE221DRAFT_62032 [Ostreococcus tauri]
MSATHASPPDPPPHISALRTSLLSLNTTYTQSNPSQLSHLCASVSVPPVDPSARVRPASNFSTIAASARRLDAVASSLGPSRTSVSASIAPHRTPRRSDSFARRFAHSLRTVARYARPVPPIRARIAASTARAASYNGVSSPSASPRSTVERARTSSSSSSSSSSIGSRDIV